MQIEQSRTLSQFDFDENAPTVTNSQMTTTDTNHKNTRNDACTLESPLTATNDTNHHESASLAEVSSKPNTKTAGKKRSQHEINLAPSTVVKKKRRLNNHSNNGNTSTSTQTQRKQRTNSSNYRHCVSKFKSSMLHDIQSIIAAKLHRNHVRKRVRCLCCDKQCVLRSKARIKAYKTCDYWYCAACHVPMDDMTRIVRQMSECIDLEHEWIVQVHWKNENEWKSAKIMSSSENEITIVYFENEMEDTINLDDDDTTLRLISNGMRCKIHDTMNSDYEEVKRRSMCYEKEDEPLLEYLVKYRTKSYLHCKWLKYSDFVGKVDEYQDADGDIEMHQDKKKMMTDLVRVVRKWRKDTRPFTYYNENAYYDASFVQIDRIINDKTVRIKKKKQRNASSKQSKKYLIKWRGLSYEQCTWELLEDLNAFNAEDTRRSVMKYNHLQKLLMERATKHKRDKNSNATTRPSKPAAIDGHLSNLVHLGHGLALKDYQKEGVDWMCYNWHESRSVLLCDEMGLGKTCQTICFLSYLHSIHYIDGPFLVIAPLSTLIHWKREIERFSTMYAVIYQGNKESRAMIFANEFYFDGIYKFNVLIMSYDMVMMEQRRLSKIPFNVMVIDEAHRIKNRECKLYHVLRTFKDPLYKILLTGTPIQNNVDEFWSLLNFVDAEYFNNLDEFVQKYGEITRLEQLDELRGLLGSHVLRRLKCDVEKELLPRTEMVIYVELTKCQKAFYRAVFEKNIAYLRSKSSIKSLRNIAMTLRKICLHPYLLNGAEEEELRRNKIELPPNLKDTLHDDDYANKDAVMQHLVSVSGKFVLCDKLLEKLRREGHKVLIYSQFTSLLDVLEDYLLWKQYEFERIDGSTSLTHRQEAIDHFVENEACFVFLLSTRAGGVGINLIAADTVIIFDSDWNPQNDIQAQSRCHRIGQNKKVSVYRLITRDSYEVYLLECAMKKLVLDDLVMAASTSTTSTTKNKKKDLAQLLKKSAEKLMNPRYDKENEEKMTKFYADDIETILNENTVKIDNVCGNQSIFENLNLSKAMFVPKDADDHELLKMDDPDFWIKLGFGNKISTENTNDFTSVIVSDKSSSNLMRLNEEQNGGKRSRKRTTKYSQFNDDMWGELGSDFEDLTDDDTAKCDSDYDEVEDAKNHCSSDDGIVEEEEDVVMCSNNTNATIAIIPTNPSYLGKTKGAIQIINILDDDEEEECVGKKHKKKKHKKKKHKKKKKKKVVVIDDSGESCNPLSDNFCAVDYLAHRTPLYQVNTINIDKIYQRKGELSTAHFVVGDWKFRVLVYPFGVDNPSYSLMNNSYLSVYLHYLGRADGNKKVDEQIQTEFRCTIHSCLGSQQDLYQELQHKFSIKSKDSFLSGFKNFLPLSLLFRTPFYLFPDPNQSKKEQGKKDKEKAANNAAEETDKERTEKKDKEKENQNVVQAADKTKKSEPKRNMAILKTELWVFPPLNWTKAKATPKSPIYIDLLDDDDDEEEEEKKKKSSNVQINHHLIAPINETMPTLEKEDKKEENKRTETTAELDRLDDDIRMTNHEQDDDDDDEKTD